jgi:nucleoside-diphosphate-sugar epimerase
MKNILIGNTGLVGQTLKENINFDYEYNSKNISQYNVYDNCNLWLSCLPATKWLVNKNPKNDLDNIIFIIDIIKKFKYNKIYLISTIDVYGDSPLVVDENFEPIFKNFNYGSNRLLFEKMVQNFLTYNSLKIYRLPALFNNKIKKNILFDLLNDNNISSINSNSFFQWFNLDELYDFMIKYDNEERLLFNLFTEPINTKEIIELFSEYKDKVGNGDYIIYNWQTNLTPSKYLYSKEEMLDKIKIFINEYRG